MLDWRGSGMSVMEMSHRGKEFIGIAAKAEADLRTLLAIPPHYKVLFLQGGAIGENAIVPLNLMGAAKSADYVNTGSWSKKSIQEAKKYCRVNVAASAEDKGFTYVPEQASWKLDPAAAYVHVCTNETIGGVEYPFTPDTGDVPLVADMSSHILSREIDVAKFGVIYAGAQKNAGTAGLTLVIVRDDLLDRALPVTPSAFLGRAQRQIRWSTRRRRGRYRRPRLRVAAEAGRRQGDQAEHRKASLLYDYVDASGFYTNPVRRQDRSRMNVPFRLKDESLDEAFLKGAKEAGMVQLKGHRSVGGMRASIYNALPIEGVRTLVAYMRDFERRRRRSADPDAEPDLEQGCIGSRRPATRWARPSSRRRDPRAFARYAEWRSGLGQALACPPARATSVAALSQRGVGVQRARRNANRQGAGAGGAPDRARNLVPALAYVRGLDATRRISTPRRGRRSSSPASSCRIRTLGIVGRRDRQPGRTRRSARRGDRFRSPHHRRRCMAAASTMNGRRASRSS
jgi:phosphoserine aminotransferase